MRILPYFLSISLFASTCLSAPFGGEVMRGSSDISYDPSRVEINQHTDRAVINWQSFDVKAGEHVKFNLPNPSSVALNRINDRKASEINGLVSSNGNLILLNPNGIVFGKDAVIDAAGIIASSSKVNIDEFMNGGDFGFSADGAGKIINKGNLSAKDSGLVGLVSPHLENHGVISAKLGKVQIASNDSYTVDLAGDGLINLAISDNQKQRIENNGKIKADTILLTASAARDIIDSLIINNGKLEAKTGSIKLYAEGSNAVPNNVAANKGIKAGQSTIINNGIIDASGKKTGQKGGNIEILADDIALLDNSKIDASGHTGSLGTYQDKEKSAARAMAAGGDIKIGGDYLGSGTTPAAQNIYVAKNAKIYADSLDQGDAGRVIIWAGKQNDFYGNVFVRGGKKSGDGGFVETSGKEKLNAHGYVTTLAPNGKRGTYLLDPTSISIYGSTTGNWPKFKSTDGTLDLQTGSPLLLWLDAMDPLNTGTPPANNASITTWYDKSGLGSPNNAGPLSGASAPTYKTTGLLGKPSVYFNGSNNALQIANNINPINQTIMTAILPSSALNSWAVLLSKWYIGHPTCTWIFQHGSSVSWWFGVKFFDSNPTVHAASSSTDWGAGGTKATLVGGYWDSSSISYIANSYVDNTSVLAGAVKTSDNTNTVVLGGEYDNLSSAYYTGHMSEVLILNVTASQAQRNLLEQYIAAKWAITLNPLNNGHTEFAQAITDGAYSVFTTRYLERLAASADISLTAGSGGILLDLQGDTLTLPSEVNFGLTTTSNGNITSNSNGTISATRTSSKGNITMSAGGTGYIDLNTSGAVSLTSNGGDISLTAGNNIKLYNVSGNTITVNNNSATSSDVYLNGTVTATATSSNSIIVASGRNFINNVGSGVFTTSGTARYLVYSVQASSNTPSSTPGGATAVYSTTYPTVPGTAGNLYIYSAALPTSLTITADNKFKFYNWPNPTFTYTVSGLPAGVQPSIVSGITLTSTAVTGSLPGIYSIIPSGGAVSGAYTIGTYTPGTITVIKTPPANKCPCLSAIGR